MQRVVVNSPKLQEILPTISILFAKHYKKFLANVQFLNSSVQATLPRTFVFVNYARLCKTKGQSIWEKVAVSKIEKNRFIQRRSNGLFCELKLKGVSCQAAQKISDFRIYFYNNRSVQYIGSFYMQSLIQNN